MNKYSAIILTFVVAAGVWLVSWLGLFVPADGWLYDHLLRVRVENRAPSEHALLVDSGQQYWRIPPEEWQETVDELLEVGAVAVVFPFTPPLSATFPANERTAKRLIIGIPHDKTAQADEIRQRGIETAALQLPPADAGIHRRATLLVDGEPGLALAAAQRLAPLEASDYNSSIRVNFSTGPDWIPVVSLQRIREQGLVPELVAGRVVLLGPIGGSQVAGLYTPVHQQDVAISLVEYQAYLIETLLLKNDIRGFSSPVLLLLLLVIAAVSTVIYQRMTLIVATRTTLIILGLNLVLSWLFLHYAALWLPLSELILVQILLFGAAIRHQQLASELQLHQFVAKAGSWLRGHLLPVGFYESSEHWAQVVNLVDQSLDLRRLIFLERIERDHRVREVKALRCSIDDIDERRRDYERAPYSTAIEEGGPIQLNKIYLKSLDGETEVQYLVPLMFAGEVIGFWAFGVVPARLEKLDKFELMVRRFATQIAELLYHRQQWLRDQHEEDRTVNRYLRMEGGAALHRQVGDALKSVERHRSMLDRVLHGLDTAIVLYDLFGRVLTVNGAMESLVKAHQLPIYDMTALDLLSRVTSMDTSQARQALNYLTLQLKPMHIPVMLDGGIRKSYLLIAKPLSRENTVSGNTEATAFDISGLLFEIIDATAINALCGMKESVVQQRIWNMRNDLESIQMGTDLLQSPKAMPAQRERAGTIVGEKLQDLIQLLDRMETDITASVQTITREGYPIETLTHIQNILSELESNAASRGIRFKCDMPGFPNLVLAQPAEFEELVRNILVILLNDAEEGTEICIRIRLENETVSYSFSNSGFGLPDEDLQRFLLGSERAVSEDFHALREGMEALHHWGGDLKASSDVGKGFSFEFTLPTVT